MFLSSRCWPWYALRSSRYQILKACPVHIGSLYNNLQRRCIPANRHKSRTRFFSCQLNSLSHYVNHKLWVNCHHLLFFAYHLLILRVEKTPEEITHEFQPVDLLSPHLKMTNSNSDGVSWFILISFPRRNACGNDIKWLIYIYIYICIYICPNKTWNHTFDIFWFFFH